MKKAVFLLMTKRGYCSLESFIKTFGAGSVEYVVSHPDKRVQKDYFIEIQNICKENNIKFYDKNDNYQLEGFCAFVIGWRWMVVSSEKFYVFHDSLLPKYRGFAPIVSQLINKETRLGVTCLYSEIEYDKGDIVVQKHINITYPIKMREAINKICPLYSSLLIDVYSKLSQAIHINGKKQNETEASYSIWRDDEDYKIDWTKDAEYIKRFIDAVGYPYLGAFSKISSKKVRIWETELYPDCKIENRNPGKIIFLKDKCPVIICGKGLLKITKAVYEDSRESLIPLKKFRVRFE